MARSKMFINPPESTVPAAEQENIAKLKDEYIKRMSALQHYLFEEDLKAGDTGAAARIAAEKEEMVHQQNIKDNEEENRRISAMREARLLEEGERRKSEIAEKIHQHDVREAERLERVEELVDREKAEMQNRIREEDLVRAIETALANPIDVEYAIDLKGNIFRGRKTKSKKVNPAYYEQIPLASENA